MISSLVGHDPEPSEILYAMTDDRGLLARTHDSDEFFQVLSRSAE